MWTVVLSRHHEQHRTEHATYAEACAGYERARRARRRHTVVQLEGYDGSRVPRLPQWDRWLAPPTLRQYASWLGATAPETCRLAGRWHVLPHRGSRAVSE